MTNIISKKIRIEKDNIQNAGCNNGNYPSYAMYLGSMKIKSGTTCGCGRGCANTDSIWEMRKINGNYIEVPAIRG